MKARIVILTVEVLTSEPVKNLKEAVRQSISSDKTVVKQIQTNVVRPTKK